jgi:hypothetical protein
MVSMAQPLLGPVDMAVLMPCLWLVTGSAFYGKTKSERCYAMDREALEDGCRRSKR